MGAIWAGAQNAQGLDCLDAEDEECLGDCPDAAYFGPHIRADSDRVKMLSLRRDDELHIVTIVNHRTLNVRAGLGWLVGWFLYDWFHSKRKFRSLPPYRAAL